MEFTAVAAAVLRRWYVVLVGIALTTGLVYGVHIMVPPTYVATGSMLLLPPGASVPNGSNALLQLGGLEQPASLVVAYLAGDEARRQLAVKYPNSTYDIVLDPLSRGPLIQFTVEDPAPDQVMGALKAVLAAVPDALSRLQDEVDAPAVARITSMPLAVDTEPTTKMSSALRAVIAAAGVGLVLTLVGAVAIDSLAVRRRERRTAAALALDSEEPEPSAAVEPAKMAEPQDADLATSVTRPRMSELTHREEQRGAGWPPLVPDEPSLNDESRVAPRA
jgi:hypothetical protein